MIPERARWWFGASIDGIGSLLAPPLMVASTYAHDGKRLAIELASLAVAAVVPGGTRMVGSRIRGGARRDVALRLAIESLATRILQIPPSSDPHLPHVRVTAFVPAKRWGQREEQLYPLLRICSGPNAHVLRFGEEGFNQTGTFKRNDAFAGQTWADEGERYRTFKALTDFAGSDEERLTGWKEQWAKVGAVRPEAWGHYMRSVRSLWTFSIPGPAGEVSNPVAVISVDSTIADAFAVLGDTDGGTPPGQSPLFQGLHLRDAIAASIAAVVLTATHRNPKSLFLKLRTALASSDARAAVPIPSQ